MKSIQSSIRQLCFARNSFGFVFINYDVKQYDYDALISDIDSDDLYGQISIRLGKNNLSPLSPGEQEFEKIRYGIIYGNLTRGIISLPSRF
jgi:hypothetical protein